MAGNLRWLFAGRALRSFTTAFLTVVFPLYLAAQGYRSATIGAVLTGGGVMGAALVVVVGILGDRFGRRRMLLGLGLLGAAGGAVLGLTGNLAAVTAASGLGGVGRGGGAGSGGSWGPVFPAEQPLLAGAVESQRRTQAFGTIAFAGVLAGAAGSLVAFLPDGLHAAGWGWVAAYRLVFWVGSGLLLAMTAAYLPIRETQPAPGAPEPAVQLSTRQLVGRLTVVNGLGGFGVGFLGPLLTYWLHVRYGAGPGQLGLLYTTVNLVTALPYLGAARLAARWGAVRAASVTRAASAACLLVMAWMPSFALAGAVLALRMALNSLGLPTRQSYVMGVAQQRRRSLVAAMGMMPPQVTSSLSPALGGLLMESLLDAPLYGAALFIGANCLTYYYAFRHVPPPEEAGGLKDKASD